MKRFWIELEDEGRPDFLKLGCGITAFDLNDAMKILEDKVFEGAVIPAVRRIIEDIDVSELDQKHVVPNMEAPMRRGVWFPRGYSF